MRSLESTALPGALLSQTFGQSAEEIAHSSDLVFWTRTATYTIPDHAGSGRCLAHPDVLHDADVGEADDDERHEVL